MSDASLSRNSGKNVRAAFVIAGAQVGGMLLLILAQRLEIIDGDTLLRGVMLLIGLGLIVTGNRLPKRPDGPPPESRSMAMLQQSVLRVNGWAMMLGGFTLAVLWAFAPVDIARTGSLIAGGAMMAVLLGHTSWRIFAYYRKPARP